MSGANLWNEVKDRLGLPGQGLSGGQQQRLCIARAIAVSPDVILMDEPCSALDPISTLAIEDLIEELKAEYTIVIVTHNMQQASRVSDHTAFFNIAGTGKPGKLIEFNDTSTIFSKPDRAGHRRLRLRQVRIDRTQLRRSRPVNQANGAGSYADAIATTGLVVGAFDPPAGSTVTPTVSPLLICPLRTCSVFLPFDSNRPADVGFPAALMYQSS